MPTLVNSEPAEVEFLDGSKGTVELRRLSIRQIYTFAEHVRGSKTPELVALCTGQPVNWVDTLTPESFAELAGKCVTSNFQTAMKIAEKDPVMAILMGPIAASGILSVAEMLPALRKGILGQTGSDSSPAPAPSASAAESGSASSI